MKTTEIEAVINEAVVAVGYVCWGVEYFPQGKYALLRVYIDSPGGITVDDCATASAQIGTVLDVDDVIQGEYTLEVSSPGLDRVFFKLSQCIDYIGQEIKCKCRQAVEGKRQWFGKLVEVTKDALIVEAEGERIVLPWVNVAKARLVYQLTS